MKSAALQGVGAADSGGVNTDENFVGSGYGAGTSADCQSLRSTVTVLTIALMSPPHCREAPSLVRDFKKLIA